MQDPQERFHVGYNVIGFQPLSEPACYDRWHQAAWTLISLMREHADEDDDRALLDVSPDAYASEEEWLASDDYPSMRATVEAVLTDDPPVEEQDYTAVVENAAHERVSFWLIRVLCSGPSER